MNDKEEQILKEIINYITENKRMPTLRYLQKKFKFKSVNSITQYIKSLERQNYLTRNIEGKLTISNSSLFFQEELKRIKIINLNDKYVQIVLNKRKKYLAYQIHNDYFKSIGILQNDILIIEVNKKLKNNELGLFIIDQKYRIMKYQYVDGFYLLSDKDELLLNKVNLIGKVIMVEKKL